MCISLVFFWWWVQWQIICIKSVRSIDLTRQPGHSKRGKPGGQVCHTTVLFYVRSPLAPISEYLHIPSWFTLLVSPIEEFLQLVGYYFQSKQQVFAYAWATQDAYRTSSRCFAYAQQEESAWNVFLLFSSYCNWSLILRVFILARWKVAVTGIQSFSGLAVSALECLASSGPLASSAPPSNIN